MINKFYNQGKIELAEELLAEFEIEKLLDQAKQEVKEVDQAYILETIK